MQMGEVASLQANGPMAEGAHVEVEADEDVGAQLDIQVDQAGNDGAQDVQVEVCLRSMEAVAMLHGAMLHDQHSTVGKHALRSAPPSARALHRCRMAAVSRGTAGAIAASMRALMRAVVHCQQRHLPDSGQRHGKRRRARMLGWRRRGCSRKSSRSRR